MRRSTSGPPSSGRFLSLPVLLTSVLGLVWVASGVSLARPAQPCGTSLTPWTVSVTPAGHERVAVRVCGIYTGCTPHDRQITTASGEIRITYTEAELPDCMCLIPTDRFADSMIVEGVPPGSYLIDVATVNCGETTIAGSTTFTLDAAAVIPVLDPRGAVLLALLLASAALWRLRG